MAGKEIKVELTLRVDPQKYGNLTQEELAEYLRSRLINVLGFRGQLKDLRVLRSTYKDEG
jgi:hypothetical protein